MAHVVGNLATEFETADLVALCLRSGACRPSLLGLHFPIRRLNLGTGRRRLGISNADLLPRSGVDFAARDRIRLGQTATGTHHQ